MAHKGIGIAKRLVANENYVCPMCKSESRPIAGQTVTVVAVNGIMFDVEDTSCYLGDILCSGGAVRMPLLPDVVWLRESSGNSVMS